MCLFGCVSLFTSQWRPQRHSFNFPVVSGSLWSAAHKKRSVRNAPKKLDLAACLQKKRAHEQLSQAEDKGTRCLPTNEHAEIASRAPVANTAGRNSCNTLIASGHRLEHHREARVPRQDILKWLERQLCARNGLEHMGHGCTNQSVSGILSFSPLNRQSHLPFGRMSDVKTTQEADSTV